MDFFSQLFDAVKSQPAAACLVLALVAIGWLVRDFRRREELLEGRLQASNDAHLQTAMQVAPLASKLITCVEVLERQSSRIPGGQ